MGIRKQASIQLEQYWNEQVKLKQASGLSRIAYCKKYDVVLSRFAYWEQKFTPSSTPLLPVKLTLPAKPDSSKQAQILCTLLFKSGTELKIYDKAIIPVLLSSLS